MKLSVSYRAEKRYKRPAKRALEKLVARLEELAGADLSEGVLDLSFVSSEEMAEINMDFLTHKGDTDVICFDYRENAGDDEFADDDMPSVEIIVCPAVAERESAKRSLAYSREITLYIAHGLLHASGYDDLKVELKRIMRRAEKRVMNAIEKEFDLDRIFVIKENEK